MELRVNVRNGKLLGQAAFIVHAIESEDEGLYSDSDAQERKEALLQGIQSLKELISVFDGAIKDCDAYLALKRK